MFSKHKYILGLAVVVVALLIVIVSSFHRFTVLQDEVTAETRSALWHVSQLEKELLRFRGAMRAYHSGSPNFDFNKPKIC